MRVYVASSWRNARHPSVVEALRAAGHEVYDYRNPTHGEWSATDQWWKRPGYRETTFPTIINGEARRRAFDTDMDALRAADAVVLVLDSGKSAHLEAGYAAGAGKLLVVLGEHQHEPELMYAMGRACVLRVEEVVAQLASAPTPADATLRTWLAAMAELRTRAEKAEAERDALRAAVREWGGVEDATAWTHEADAQLVEAKARLRALAGEG